MRKNILVFIVSLIFFSTMSCDNSTSPSNSIDIQGITETNESGEIIGNFDFDDWDSPNWFLDKKIDVYPIDSITFYLHDTTTICRHTLRIQNHSNETLSLVISEIGFPFQINHNAIILGPNKTDTCEISFRLPSITENVYIDTLFLSSFQSELLKIKLKGIYVPPGAVTVIPNSIPKYSFLPAYPNPASNNITFKFSISKDELVEIKIINNNNNVIYEFSENLNGGLYTLRWNMHGRNGEIVSNGIYRALFETNSFVSHGDIEIINLH